MSEARKGKKPKAPRCPDCGGSVDRGKCLLEYGSTCPRHPLLRDYLAKRRAWEKTP